MTDNLTDLQEFDHQALVIEDDRKQAAIFAQALRMAEYQTEIIADGQLARQRLAEMTPDLVVLDLHLPHISGEQILRQIRADSRLDSTRVMLATADPALAETLRTDTDLILLKPISFNQLRDLAARLRPRPI